MKSPYCKQYAHQRCMQHLHLHPDCDCFCHYELAEERGEDTAPSSVVEIAATPLVVDTPPPHPEAFDHGKYRVAAEPYGTNLNDPWRLSLCRECNQKTWTRNYNPKLYEDVMCEACAYLLLEQVTEMRVKRENQPSKPVNPFEHR